MRRPSLSPLFLAAAFAVCVLLPSRAWAKYTPPPLGAGQHVVTEVGWLSPADVRKLDDEASVATIKTGFVLDVLLAKGDEPIDEVASETFAAWKPGDPGKENGILLVLQPNFPKGERKARLQVGKAVQGLITPAKARDVLRDTIGPLMNGSDQVRAAVAEGIQAIATIVGSADHAPPAADAAAPSPKAATSASPATGPTPSPEAEEGSSSALRVVLVSAVLVAVGLLAFRRLRVGSKAGKKS
jgi:uncharacterized protein